MDIESDLALDIPLFPLDEDEHSYIVFLPGVRMDDLEDVTYNIDAENQLFEVYCVYEYTDENEPVGDMYPLDLNERRRDQIEHMDNLMVLDPRRYDPEDLADDSQSRDVFEQLFERLRELEDMLFDDDTDVGSG